MYEVSKWSDPFDICAVQTAKNCLMRVEFKVLFDEIVHGLSPLCDGYFDPIHVLQIHFKIE